MLQQYVLSSPSKNHHVGIIPDPNWAYTGHKDATSKWIIICTKWNNCMYNLYYSKIYNYFHILYLCSTLDPQSKHSSLDWPSSLASSSLLSLPSSASCHCLFPGKPHAFYSQALDDCKQIQNSNHCNGKIFFTVLFNNQSSLSICAISKQPPPWNL